MNPLVSVVVTTYNQAAYIEQTLESVFAQTYDSYEVIVVDDGSTDDTPARLARFNGRIEYVRQLNTGVAGSRNTGVVKARGEFIAFLDGDDLWEAEKLSFQVAEARRHPEAGLIAVDGLQFDGDRIIEPTLFFGPACNDLPEESVTSGSYYHQLLHNQFIYTTSQVMVPAKVLRAVGLSDGRFKRASDYDLYLRIAAKYDFVIIKKRLTRWRYLPTSASGPMLLRLFNYLLEDVAILRHHLALCHKRDRALIRGVLKRKLAEGMERLYRYGLAHDRPFATRALLTLLAASPVVPVAFIYLAGLWCPAVVRDRFAPVVRRMLCGLNEFKATPDAATKS